MQKDRQDSSAGGYDDMTEVQTGHKTDRGVVRKSTVTGRGGSC